VTSEPFLTESIRDEDPATGFRCGKAPLDEFFAKHALPNDRRGLGKTFVLRSRGSEPEIVGYYTLSMADVEVEELPAKVRRGLPRYPVPVARVGRLAIDERAQGHGHGSALLEDALRRVDAAARTLGCMGVVVDAKDQAAVGFYARYGFVVLDDHRVPTPMFLSLKVLRKAIDSE
jgi:ribosomal protein S18 acetylase RimI-like enzyme